MTHEMDRAAYAAMFGPTTGDRVRLADTDLIIEVEDDRIIYGEEVKFGGGKVIRDGMGQSQVSRADGAVDTVITNALIVDHWGIVKADIGIRDGRISPPSARPATPTSSPESTSSSAPAPRRSRARGASSPPAASTPTSTGSARSWSRRRCIPASPPCWAAAPARPRAPTRPRARRVRGTWRKCRGRPTDCR